MRRKLLILLIAGCFMMAAGCAGKTDEAAENKPAITEEKADDDIILEPKEVVIEEKEEIKPVEISKMLNFSPEKMTAELNMGPAEPWQFGDPERSFAVGGLSLEWMDEAVSVKCEADMDYSIFGIVCGQTVEEAAKLLTEDGWQEQNRGSNSAVYYKEDGKGTYLFEVNFSEEDNTIDFWYWNNWPQGEFFGNEEAAEPTGSDEGWKTAYIDYIRSVEGEGWYGYHLVYIDADDIPELYLMGNSTAQGDLLCTYINGAVNSMHISNYGLSYIERQNLFCNSGGRMDSYYDIVYQLVGGDFVEIHSGDYGAEDNTNIQVDENGYPVYRYYWDGDEVSESDYQNLLNSVFDSTQALHAPDYQNSAEDVIRQIQEVG